MDSRTSSALLVAALALGACGGATAARSNETSNGSQAAGSRAAALELEVAQPGGGYLYLSDMRSRPVLIFLFATFDTESQAMLSPLTRVAEQHPDVQVLGVAVQPDARRLIPMFIEALSPPFPITYDATGEIARGESDLGPIGVPMVVVLDAEGVPVAADTGYHSARELDEMLAAVR